MQRDICRYWNIFSNVVWSYSCLIHYNSYVSHSFDRFSRHKDSDSNIASYLINKQNVLLVSNQKNHCNKTNNFERSCSTTDLLKNLFWVFSHLVGTYLPCYVEKCICVVHFQLQATVHLYFLKPLIISCQYRHGWISSSNSTRQIQMFEYKLASWSNLWNTASKNKQKMLSEKYSFGLNEEQN